MPLCYRFYGNKAALFIFLKFIFKSITKLILYDTQGDLLARTFGIKYACVTGRKEEDMNSTQSSLEELCNSRRIDELLRDYLCSCYAYGEDEEKEEEDHAVRREGKTKKKVERGKYPQKSCFPNLAGFCRFLGIGTRELESFGSEHPDEYGKILAVFEDEALNSGLSATLVSAYLKKRLGYDSSTKNSSELSGLQISFEHDIFEDGE